MINQFRANRPYNNLLTILYGLLILWPIYCRPTLFSITSDNQFLYRYLSIDSHPNFSCPSILFSVIAISLLVFQSILLNHIASTFKLYTKQHYTAGIVYLLGISLFGHHISLSPELISSTICLFILYKIPSLQNTSSPKSLLFNIGNIVGLSTLIFSPAICYVIVVCIALIFTRPIKLSEWGMVFLGVITPFYLIACTLFLLDEPIDILLPAFIFNKPIFLFNKISLSFCITWSIIFVIGFFYVQQHMNKLLYQSKITWSIINMYLIISGLCVFFNNNNRMTDIYFIMGPLSLLECAFFVYSDKSTLISLFHWIILIASLCFNFVNFYA